MNARFEKLSKDVIVKIALTLDLPEILSLCMVSKKFNLHVCENRYFWISRLKQDFDIRYLSLLGGYDPKYYYQWISRLKQDLNIDYLNISPDGMADPQKYYNFFQVGGWLSINSQFFLAIKEGYIDIVEYTIRKGATRFNDGIKIASEDGHEDIVKLMLRKGADPNLGLYGATLGNHEDIIKLVIDEGANDWNLGLNGASLRGHIGIAKYMLREGGNPNVGLRGGASGGNVDIVKLMIEEGANNWNEGLYTAVSSGHLPIIELIIDVGDLVIADLKESLTLASLRGRRDIYNVIEKEIEKKRE